MRISAGARPNCGGIFDGARLDERLAEIEQQIAEPTFWNRQAEAQQVMWGQQGQNGQESRNIEFEKIKFDMQKLSQMQQAMSNVLNTMDELAKSAIRQIKSG